MLTDTHAHLDFPDFATELDKVLARAEAAGVNRIITIGTTLESSRRAVELASQYRNVYATVGVHPSNAADAPEDVITPLRELARHPRVVAIGECGLDYHRLPSRRMHEAAVATPAFGNETPADVEAAVRDGAVKARQAIVFQQQLELAVELGFNVVVHQRDSWDDTLKILRDYTGRLSAVFHCFGGSMEQANQLLGRGHLVSFTGIVTFKNAQVVRDTVERIGDGHFMVETDSPYLAPHPYRGKRCEPAYVRLVAEHIAQLRRTTLSDIAEQTEHTANGFFRFSA